MNPITVPALASAFKLGGLFIGVPSLAGLLFCATSLLQLQLSEPLAETQFGSNPDALMLMLKGFTQAMGALSALSDTLAVWVLSMALVAAGAGLVLGLACWFIGRGLQRGAAWARWAGSGVLLVGLLAALMFGLSLSGASRLLAVAAAAAASFALHALWAGARPAVA